MSHLGNAAQLSASTVGLEHEDAQHHKDDDCVDVGGGEGGLQTTTHGVKHHPHGNQNTQSCIQTDRHGFQDSFQERYWHGVNVHKRDAGSGLQLQLPPMRY